MTEAVILERHGSVACLQLNRPEVRNALSGDVKAALEKIVPDLVNDRSVRALLITGSGAAFCAGSDLGSWKDRSPVGAMDRVKQSHAWIRVLANCDMPIVVAVNGMAVGAGLGLALLGDVIIAADQARFQAGFPRVGAAADYGTAFTLPRIVGMNRAKDILLTNRAIDAAEALSIGLVSRVVPAASLREESLAIAHTLADGPPVAMGLTKQLLRASPDLSFEQFLGAEALAQAIAVASADFGEGIDAFLARRQPVFRGA